MVLAMENIGKNQGDRPSSYRGGIVGSLPVQYSLAGVALNQGDQDDKGNQDDFKKE